MSTAWNSFLLSWRSPGERSRQHWGLTASIAPLELSPDTYWVELILLPLLPLLWDRSAAWYSNLTLSPQVLPAARGG